jgi:hypothetical protein
MKTLKEWGDELARYAARVGLKCFCWSALYGGTVEGYDHDGGVEVEGFKEKQWVYLTCTKCGHQWSFQHILRSQVQEEPEDEEDEGGDEELEGDLYDGEESDLMNER